MPLKSMHPLNKQQYYLDVMGIPVWREKTAVVAEPEKKSHACVRPIANLNWDDLQETVSHCQACPLHQSRTQTVFGVGNRQSPILFVGEAPGFHEDQQGEPFVGRAGQLLDAMLAAVGYSRTTIYIANILKCRPPNNRDPSAEEVAECTPFLQRQIALIQPNVIVALGRIAAHYLLKNTAPMHQLRGQKHHFENIPLIVTYHPAYLLRSPQDKSKAWQDLLLIQNFLI